ncbi:MAG TPA: ABC transporter substrate-binding protein, partial [Bacteroidales bacterium]|nr:ABC transporter substrate-binding protein [Bacteroidales bacterium]
DLLTEFPKWYKQQTGEDVRIVYQVFDMTEVMYTKIALGKEDFDLVCPTHVIMERMLKNNLLLPINKNIGESRKNFNNISPFIRERLAAFSMKDKKAEDYVVPYMWGTSGILYNTHLISKEEVSSWKCLWNPKNAGKILMKDSYCDAYNVASIYGNYNDMATGKRSLYQVANDYSPHDFAVVEKELKKLKPNLAGWEADFGKEMMTKGKIWINYAWSGDAVWAIEEAASVGVNLDYVVPQEGSNIWFDGWVIPRYAQNSKAASYFLAYLCQPEVALRNMDVSGYCSAIASPEIKESAIDTSLSETVNLSYFFGPGNDKLHINSIQYPDSSVVARCAIFHDFLDKNDLALEMWSRAKGDNLNRDMAVMILLFFFFLGTWLIYRRIKKYQSTRRRLKKGRNRQG